MAIAPRARLETHTVENQPPPFAGRNLYLTDLALREAVQREAGDWLDERASALGAVAGSEDVLALGEAANRNKPELVKAARGVYEDLRQQWMITYDSGSNIGKLYRRQDEIGTPFCITVDFQTLDDEKVTIRERDSMDQSQFGRVPIAELRGWLDAHLDY